MHLGVVRKDKSNPVTLVSPQTCAAHLVQEKLGRGNLTQNVEKRLGLRLGQDSIGMLFATEKS